MTQLLVLGTILICLSAARAVDLSAVTDEKKLSPPATASVETSGSLKTEQVREVLRQHREDVKSCYVKALKKNSKLSGRLVLRWKVTAQGSVESVSVERSDLAMPSLEDCLKSFVKGLTFPRSENHLPTVVVYPFVFATRSTFH